MRDTVFHKLETSVECYRKGEKVLIIPYTTTSVLRIQEKDNKMVLHTDNLEFYFTGIDCNNYNDSKTILKFYYNGLYVGQCMVKSEKWKPVRGEE